MHLDMPNFVGDQQRAGSCIVRLFAANRPALFIEERTSTFERRVTGGKPHEL
jgi:hypothetical protein